MEIKSQKEKEVAWNKRRKRNEGSKEIIRQM